MRPFVRINMAVSADGKVATANRAVHTFGSPRDGIHLHELRARSDAILCGARTVEETGATLGNGGARFDAWRIRHGKWPRPLRVIVSGSASISPKAALWKDRSAPIIAWVTEAAPASRRRRLSSLADVVWTSPGETLDVLAGLRWLWKAQGVRHALLEGGGSLNDAFARAGAIDELHLTWCPMLMAGARSPTPFDGLGFGRLEDAARFQLHSMRRHGDEWFLVYRQGHGHGRGRPDGKRRGTDGPTR